MSESNHDRSAGEVVTCDPKDGWDVKDIETTLEAYSCPRCGSKKLRQRAAAPLSRSSLKEGEEVGHCLGYSCDDCHGEPLLYIISGQNGVYHYWRYWVEYNKVAGKTIK